MEKGSVRIPNQKRSIEKKNTIVEVAYQMFLSRGYFDINTAEIAKEANLSTGSVYSYFKDKKDILLACLDKFKNELLQQLLHNIEETPVHGDIFEVAKRLIQAFVEFHRGERAYHYDIMSLQYRDEDVRNFFLETEKSMMSAIVEQLKKAGYEFRHEREQTFLIFSMIRSLEEQLLFKPNKEIRQDILIEECARFLALMVTKKEADTQ